MSTSFLNVGIKFEKPKVSNDPDLIIIEKEEGKSEIVIAQIHELQRQLTLMPLGGAGRLVVIIDAQTLNVSAQNALLKTLEEPPVNTIIKLYVDHEDNLLPTIVSRCIIIRSTPNSQSLIPDLNLLNLIKENNIKEGFKWAETIKERTEAVRIIDDMLTAKEAIPVFRKLQKAKKYLMANCNVRLTLENLFIL